jgi:hypothetical protein
VVEAKDSCGRRKRSLLIGLSVVLFISSIELATDCMQYRLGNAALVMAQQTPHFGSDPEFESTIGEIQDNRDNARLWLVSHGALLLITLGNLWDGICISRWQRNAPAAG